MRPPTPPRRSGRIRKPSSRTLENTASAPFQDEDRALLASLPRITLRAFFAGSLSQPDTHNVVIPSNFSEAVSSKQASKWMEAMQTELQCLSDHNAWDLIDLPEDASLFKGRWVYTIKTDVNSKAVVYKAR